MNEAPKYPPSAPDSWRRTLVRSAASALLPASVMVMRGPASKKQVALTFDDGPDTLTGEYLDVLDRLEVRATFFIIGGRCQYFPGGLLEIVRRGHEVASHGFSHTKFPSLSAEALAEELQKTADLLPPPLGRPLLRPPQGATSLASLRRSAAAGYTTVLWSLDSDDCRTESSADVTAKLAPDRVRPGEIVLLHEGQRWTLEALPPVVDGLRAGGYELVTVGELLRR